MSEPEESVGDQIQANHPEPEPTVQPEPEPTEEPLLTSGSSHQPAPPAPLYALVLAHRSTADRPVMTPRGPGHLWQVFSNRAGVVLDAKPGQVTFFDPSEIQVAAAPELFAGDVRPQSRPP